METKHSLQIYPLIFRIKFDTKTVFNTKCFLTTFVFRGTYRTMSKISTPLSANPPKWSDTSNSSSAVADDLFECAGRVCGVSA